MVCEDTIIQMKISIN